MIAETFIRNADQIPVELLLAHAGLVAGDEENRLTFRVKGERYSPFSVGARETQLLHVRVARTFESVAVRPVQLRAELGEHTRQRCDFDLHAPGKVLRFARKLTVETDVPQRRCPKADYVLDVICS